MDGPLGEGRRLDAQCLDLTAKLLELRFLRREAFLALIGQDPGLARLAPGLLIGAPFRFRGLSSLTDALPGRLQLAVHAGDLGQHLGPFLLDLLASGAQKIRLAPCRCD